MNNTDRQIFELYEYILKNGTIKKDRTGTGTISVFDYTMRFNMKEGFPLLTSKKMFMKGIVHELIWFLKGETNIKYLLDNGVNIWTGDAYKKYRNTPKNSMENGDLEFLSASHAYEDYYNEEDFVEMIKKDSRFAKKWGELGPVYGSQWRNWNGVDQIKNLIDDLKNNPDSRRLIVNAWNVDKIDQMTLPPCHYVFQCWTRELTLEERIDIVEPNKELQNIWVDNIIHNSKINGSIMKKMDELNVPKRALSLKWNQRSVDSFLGLPFNIASYALLLHLLAREVNMVSEDLIFSGGDVHLYSNHIDQVNEQLARETFSLPKIELTNTSIEDIKYEDIKLINYISSKSIKAKLSN